MKLIETLSEKISEEICDAKSYAELALENRETYPELAQTLYDLSVEEMGHMSRLHLFLIPAIAICLIVLSLNLLGDGLRDAFDPKLQK